MQNVFLVFTFMRKFSLNTVCQGFQRFAAQKMNGTNLTLIRNMIVVPNFLLGGIAVCLNLVLIVALLRTRSLTMPGFRLLLINLSTACIIMSVSLCVSEGINLEIRSQDLSGIQLFYCQIIEIPIATTVDSIGYWLLGMAIDRIRTIMTVKRQESKRWMFHGKVSKTFDTLKL